MIQLKLLNKHNTYNDRKLRLKRNNDKKITQSGTTLFTVRRRRRRRLWH